MENYLEILLGVAAGEASFAELPETETAVGLFAGVLRRFLRRREDRNAATEIVPSGSAGASGISEASLSASEKDRDGGGTARNMSDALSVAEAGEAPLRGTPFAVFFESRYLPERYGAAGAVLARLSEAEELLSASVRELSGRGGAESAPEAYGSDYAGISEFFERDARRFDPGFELF